VIPLNDIAFAAVDRALELARKRGSKDPDHYLFPFRIRGNGTSGVYVTRGNDPFPAVAPFGSVERWLSNRVQITEMLVCSRGEAGLGLCKLRSLTPWEQNPPCPPFNGWSSSRHKSLSAHRTLDTLKVDASHLGRRNQTSAFRAYRIQ